MSSDRRLSAPTRLLLKAAANVALVWALHTYLPQFFTIFGGVPAFIVIGALITLMNLIIRPILNMLISPLRIFAVALAFIIVNGAFVYLTLLATLHLDPGLVSLVITGGVQGWITVSLCFGGANLLLKEL